MIAAPDLHSPVSDARPSLDDRRLRRATALFAAAVIVHNADHLRRGVDKLNGDVFAVGTAGIVIEVALVILIYQRHRLAPLAAALGGVGLALGYLEVHFVPAHAVLSDSFPSAPHVSPLSWAAASFEILAALILSGIGAAALRHRGGHASGAQPVADQRRLIDAFRLPVPLVLIATQAVTLIASLVEVVHG